MCEYWGILKKKLPESLEKNSSRIFWRLIFIERLTVLDNIALKTATSIDSFSSERNILFLMISVI